MRLSQEKDLLLVISISLAVLIISWLQLIKGDTLTILQYIAILLIPGYALITAIWPTDERFSWTMRIGIGFVLGLFFVLFLPLILKSLKLGYIAGNLTYLLLIAAIIFASVAMARRLKLESEKHPEGDDQLTLEESIHRVHEMEKQAEKAEFIEQQEPQQEEWEGDSEKEDSEDTEDFEEEPQPDFEYLKKEHVEDGGEEESVIEESVVKEPILEEVAAEEPVEEPDKYDYLNEEKPIQYARMHRTEFEDEHDEEEFEPVKTRDLPDDYEEEMYRPVWLDEEPPKKPGFKYWDLVLILFLSGVSLLFLYYNPLKTTTTSLIFFILLLFILGYASITIIFPDKSRATVRNLMIASGIIAVVLFVLSFLACSMGILPDVPKYMVQILIIASVILIAAAFIRKWQISKKIAEEIRPEEYEEIIIDKDEEYPETEVKELKPPEEEPPVVPEKEVSPVIPEKEEEPSAIPEKEETFIPFKTPPEKKTLVEPIKGEPMRKAPSVGVKPGFPYMDILLIVMFTLLTAAFILIPPLNKTFIRTILGVLLVLFIPGYSLIAALFPKKEDLEGIERTALSFGLSIAVTPLIGLALNYTPWGIRLDPILISLTAFTMIMCLIAFMRRRKLPNEEKFTVPFHEFLSGIKGSFKGESRTEKILSIILIISIILAISTTVYIIIKPKEGEKFTEFYILGPNGKASDYPTNLTQGQNGSVIIGMVNHEYATKDYRLVVKVNGNTTLQNQTITLTKDQKMEIPFNFTAGATGQKKMEFLLYKLPDQENPYRSLHLWLNIT